MFFGRVVFPIFDPADRPVAFGGRVLPEAHRREGAPEGPKYLNTRETPVFHKSKVLYGVNWARGEVARAKRLVLVEGYTDVIGFHGAGVGEAVATCGTSLTEQHMHEISRRFGDVRIVLCLDADPAGQAAMSRERTGELAGAYAAGETVKGGWLPVGRGWLPEVYVATLPAGTDPADFARESGGDAVAKVLDEAVPLVEFLLVRALAGESSDTPDARTRAVRKGAEVLSQVGDSLLRSEYTITLADRVGVEAYEVAKVVEARAGKPVDGRREPVRRTEPEAVPLSGHHRVEREVLRALVASPSLFAGEYAPSESDFTLPLHRSLFRLVGAERDERGAVDAARLADRVQDAELRRAVTELAMGDSRDAVDAVAGREMLVRLKAFALSRQIEECQAQLRKLDPHREAAAYDALFEEMVVLEKQRRAIRG
jgi:DNA primase